MWTISDTVANVNIALAAVSFTPSATNDLSYRIITRIRDTANTGPADGIITLNVTRANNAPVVTSTAVTSVTQGSAYSYTIKATDADGDRLAYASANTLPSWLSLGASDAIDIIAGALVSSTILNPYIQLRIIKRS